MEYNLKNFIRTA